ncbi:UNVERIFIED_CONTAM: hypothetical protein MKS84_14870 [Pseudomonas sp. JL1]
MPLMPPLSSQYQGWQIVRRGCGGVKQHSSVFDFHRHALEWGNGGTSYRRATSDIEARTVEGAMDLPGYQATLIQWLGQMCALVAVRIRHTFSPAKQYIYPTNNLS